MSLQFLRGLASFPVFAACSLEVLEHGLDDTVYSSYLLYPSKTRRLEHRGMALLADTRDMDLDVEDERAQKAGCGRIRPRCT